MNLAAESHRTTDALRDAPPNAIYVWCNGMPAYPRDVCQRLKRDDIKVVTPQWLISGDWRGVNPDRVVLDHALFYSEERTLNAALVEFLAWVANRPRS